MQDCIMEDMLDGQLKLLQNMYLSGVIHYFTIVIHNLIQAILQAVTVFPKKIEAVTKNTPKSQLIFQPIFIGVLSKSFV